MENDEEFIKEWEEERKKGKFKYILAHTIRHFSILFLVIPVITFLVVGYVSMYTGTHFFDILTIRVLKTTLINIFVALTGFTISKYFEWNNNEKKYNKLLNSK